MGFPGSSDGSESACNAGDPGLIPGSGSPPGERDRLPTPLFWGFPWWVSGEGNGNPLQYSCLENPRDGGAWWTAVYGVTQSQTRLKQLSSSSSSSCACTGTRVCSYTEGSMLCVQLCTLIFFLNNIPCRLFHFITYRAFQCMAVP